jgi:hypothetical protein
MPGVVFENAHVPEKRSPITRNENLLSLHIHSIKEKISNGSDEQDKNNRPIPQRFIIVCHG